MRTLPLALLMSVFAFACSGPSTTHDAARVDAPIDAASDATTDTPPVDVMDAATSGALGSPCMHDTDCTSGICLSIGRCSIPCAMRSDCPLGPNWVCEGVPGRHGPVCACAPQGSTEIPCNMIDDDCDGVVDNGDTSCNGHCTNLMTDDMNCGACGIPCAAGSVCQNGMCGCPPDRPLLCGVHCLNPIGDVLNCGGCGNACPPGANASAACLGGMCTLTCSPGFADCDHDLANGCEADTRSGPANCGACGHACVFSNASAICSTGSCVMGACNTGFTDCDMSSLNGCEASLTNDVMNCGACGHSCAVPNAVSGCTGGACTLTSCSAGFANCDGNAANGCEVDVHSDPHNCGVCGGACPGLAAPNTTATCSAGGCGITCATGYADCDGVAANGCETSINTAAHCGSCTTACPAGQSCTSGTCGLCSAGMTVCGGACANLATDTANCGACGNHCVTGAGCVSGVCSCPSGEIACAGACTATGGDPNNCGGCGIVCPSGESCVSASCVSGGCTSGMITCSGSCVDPQTNTNNCGGCGNVCPSGDVCRSGACTASSPCSGAPDITAGGTFSGNTCTGITGFDTTCGFRGQPVSYFLVNMPRSGLNVAMTVSPSNFAIELQLPCGGGHNGCGTGSLNLSFGGGSVWGIAVQSTTSTCGAFTLNVMVH